MPSDLLNTDPIVSHSFFLEIDGATVAYLTGFSGMDMEVEVVTTQQVSAKGLMQTVKTVGNQTKTPDLTLKRNAPPSMEGDELWAWFNDVRDKGMVNAARGGMRKNGSIVVYDQANAEISRYNFYNAWPSKIATSDLGVEKNEAITETITLVCERLERKK
jgi:phage tail-like protein